MKKEHSVGRAWASNLVAGITSGLVAVVYSVSFAALIFSERLTPFFPQGVGAALIGATLAAIMVAWRSPFPFAIAGPEANSAIILALAARSIATALPLQDAAVYPTVWAAIILGTITSGLFLYLLGRFRLGQLARYVPYPVIGGFLAGTGCLIAKSSFKVMTGIPLNWAELPRLWDKSVAPEWIAGLGVAALLVAVLARFKHFLVLPGFLLGGIVVSNGVRLLLAQRQIDASHWFFEPFSAAGVWQAWTFSTITEIHWNVLWHQSGLLLAMVAIVTLSILLNATGLELASGRNVDLNDELRADGLANLINGLCGGMVGYLSINRCLLNQRAGASSPVAGIIAGLFCGSVLIVGSSVLASVPKPLLGGLLLSIGWNLIVRWVWRSFRQLPPFDYLLVVAILLVIVWAGFIPGIASGILIACILFIVSYGRTSSIKYKLSGRAFRSNVYRSGAQQSLLESEGDSISIFVLHGFVFFGTANDLLDRVRERLANPEEKKLTVALFDFRLVTGLDSSAVLSFQKLGQIAEKAHLQMIFTQISPRIEAQLVQGGLGRNVRSGFVSFPDLDRGMECCENTLLDHACLLNLPPVPLAAQLAALMNSAELASVLLAYVEKIDLQEGDYLFRQGDSAGSLYFLEAGRVSIVLELANGTTLRRRTYTHGTIVGEMGFFSGAPRSASVIADQPSHLHGLSHEAFRQIERDLPLLAARFNQGIVNLIADRLRRSEEEVKNLLQ